MKRMAFADAYIRLANATKAAIEAGYSAHSACVTGSKLLRHPKVQELIQSKFIRRDVHAEQTYRNFILLADGALKEAAEMLGWSHPETRHPDPEVRARALEVAGKAAYRLGKVEGLFIERIEAHVSVEHVLQGLVERLRTVRSPALEMAALPVLELPTAWKSIDEATPANGNGNGNGNGHGP